MAIGWNETLEAIFDCFGHADWFFSYKSHHQVETRVERGFLVFLFE